MANYNIISKSLWRSAKFKAVENPRAQLLFLYFLNGPHSNSCGCYVIHVGYIMADFKWTEAVAREAINDLIKASLIGYDFKSDTLYLPKFFEHNAPANPNHAAKIFNDTLSIPHDEFRAKTLRDLSMALDAKGWKLKPEKQQQLDTLLKGYREGYPHLTYPNPTQVDDDVSADEKPKSQTFEIGQRLAKITGWENDPRWAGNYSLVQVWLDRGFDPELDIIPTVQAVMAKRGNQEPPTSMKYFDKAVAQAFADRTRAITIPEGKHHEKTNGSNYGSNGKSRRAREVLDRALNESRERDGQENPERLALPEL